MGILGAFVTQDVPEMYRINSVLAQAMLGVAPSHISAACVTPHPSIGVDRMPRHKGALGWSSSNNCLSSCVAKNNCLWSGHAGEQSREVEVGGGGAAGRNKYSEASAQTSMLLIGPAMSRMSPNCSVTAVMVAMQAIEFVQMQQDDELWELLISLALDSPVLTGATPPSFPCPSLLAFLALAAHFRHSPCTLSCRVPPSLALPRRFHIKAKSTS